MIKIWKDINDWLNFYGGFISTVSFIVSLLIYFKTGQIKNNIKSLLSHEKYLQQKEKSKNNFQGILDSIQKDHIFDQKLLGEIHREISALDHYRLFFDRKMMKNMNDIKRVLKKDTAYMKCTEMIVAINKILGDLDIDEIYVG
ncbi:MAG: hypothetical protein HFH34_09030 [Eubacterium sp.]|nr:hypothetical protein [Eubacterium sp.]